MHIVRLPASLAFLELLHVPAPKHVVLKTYVQSGIQLCVCVRESYKSYVYNLNTQVY